MTITCNKLPEQKPTQKKEMSETEKKLFMMYQLGTAFQKADPVGAKLVEEMMLSFNKTPEEKNQLAQKLRKHFGIKTEKEIKAERAKKLAKLKRNARNDALRSTIFKCFYRIGFTQYRNRFDRNYDGIAFKPESGRGKDLFFKDYEEAKAWLLRAEAWDEKAFQSEVENRIDNIEYFSNLGR